MKASVFHGKPCEGDSECYAGACPQDDPVLKECHAGVCRGKIIPLLFEVGTTLSQENDLDLALEIILGFLRENMNIERAMINLHHRETGRIFIHKSLGLTKEEAARGVYFPGEGITGRAVETAQTVVVSRIGDEPGFLNRTGGFSREEISENSFICVPILRGKKVLGSISVMRRYQSESLLQKHVDTLVVITYMLAQAVELYLVENVDKVRWEQRHQELLGALRARYRPPNIIGASRAMVEVFGLAHRVAQTKATVLLLGESGVGKEVIANAIHYDSPSSSGPMIKFNCAALPESILESELFGHEKGAFTGAMQTRKGRFEEADGGTLFMDEVGELPLSVQAKLLRVLQEKTFERVGGNKPITVNIRIIAATNKDLAAMVEQGTFRQDLYFRLNVFPLLIPPLRDRGADIITLAEHFLERFAREADKKITRISTTALNLLMSYHWPGNVRELENVIERAVILAEDDAIHGYNLPPSLQSPALTGTTEISGLEAKLAAVEYEMLVEALRFHRGNTTEAARELRLTRRTIGLRMKKFHLDYRNFRVGHAPA